MIPTQIRRKTSYSSWSTRGRPSRDSLTKHCSRPLEVFSRNTSLEKLKTKFKATKLLRYAGNLSQCVLQECLSTRHAGQTSRLNMENFDKPTSTHSKASAMNSKEISSAAWSASGKDRATKTPRASGKKGPDRNQSDVAEIIDYMDVAGLLGARSVSTSVWRI